MASQSQQPADRRFRSAMDRHFAHWQKVEHYRGKFKFDLFGIWDYLVLGHGGLVGVQLTSGPIEPKLAAVDETDVAHEWFRCGLQGLVVRIHKVRSKYRSTFGTWLFMNELWHPVTTLDVPFKQLVQALELGQWTAAAKVMQAIGSDTEPLPPRKRKKSS